VDLDPNDEAALNVALNKISGEWDIPKLSDLLSELDANGFEATLTGFDLKELEGLLGKPLFSPESMEEQGPLDQTQLQTCPNCGHEFMR